MNDIPSPLMGLDAEITRLAELRGEHRRQHLPPLASGPNVRRTIGRAMIRAGVSIAGNPRIRR